MVVPQEGPLTLTQAASEVGASRGTVRRWCKAGVRGVRLAYRRAGTRIMIERPALIEFEARLRGEFGDDRTPPADREDARRRADEALRRLKEAGWD